MLNLNQLDSLVRAANPATTDADLAAQLSVPVKTPKLESVTYRALGGAWGTALAATFFEQMQAVIAAGGSFGPVAAFIDSLLRGPGIDPSNPEVPAQSSAFVAAGLLTQDEVDGVFFDLAHPAGDIVTAADVAASRPRVADIIATEAWAAQQMEAASAAARVYATYVNEYLPTVARGGPITAFAAWVAGQGA